MRLLKLNPIIVVLITLLAIWFGGALIITFIEQDNFDNMGTALWWTIVTMTTVGYGDFTPHTFLGRLFAIIIMLSGISLIAIITGTISSIFTSKKIMEDRGLEKINLSGHIVLCGWNTNAQNIISNLVEHNKNLNFVLINEELESEMNSVLSKFKQVKYVKGDYALDSILINASIEKAEHAIILSDAEKYNDDKTIISALTMKNINSEIKIIADLVNKDKVPYLKRANIDTIILKDEFENNMINSQILQPGVPEAINTLMTTDYKNNLRSVEIPKEFIGKTFVELKNHFYETQKLLCVGLYNAKGQLVFSDFLSSDSSGLDAFIEKKLENSGHSLDKDNSTHVQLNPDKDYIIKKYEGAIVID